MPTDTITELPAEIESAVETMLQLTAAQRLEICRRLEAGLSQKEIDDAWSSEIARRIDEIKNGTAELIPAEVVFREAEERLNARS